MRNALKISTVLLVLAIGSGAAATAQTTTTPAPPPHGQWHHHAPDPERETKMLTKRLALTPEQSAQVEPILADRAQKMEALKPAEGTQPDFKAMHAQRKAIMDDSKARLDAILTDTQKQQLAAMHQHGHRGNWKNGNTPAPTA